MFLDRLKVMAGGSAAAAALLPVLKANTAKAAVIAADDPRIAAERVSFPGESGDMRGYLARPAGVPAPLPGVMVIHENRGLNPHIEDVARRVALGGFTALAPDFLTPAGGTPEDEDRARGLISGLDEQATLANAVAGLNYLRERRDGPGKVGVVGFCWGGGLANRVATFDPMLDAAVAYYGRQPSAEAVPGIQSPLLLHYAGLDERIGAGIPAFRQALDAAGKDYTIYVYEGVNHAFNNDTSEARYDAPAADLAWERTMAFLERNLKT